MLAPNKLPDGAPAIKIDVQSLTNLSTNISAGGSTDFELTPTEISGYTASGLAGASCTVSGTVRTCILRFGKHGSKMRITLMNPNSSTATVTSVTYTIIYVKD